MSRAALIAFGCALVLTPAAHAAAPNGSDVERSADPRDKIVCKRFAKTGSLVDSYRTCKKKSEWERERDNLRQINPSSSCNPAAMGGTC
jgi:hypothetical protein